MLLCLYVRMCVCVCCGRVQCLFATDLSRSKYLTMLPVREQGRKRRGEREGRSVLGKKMLFLCAVLLLLLLIFSFVHSTTAVAGDSRAGL
jgi:hypothetical protein